MTTIEEISFTTDFDENGLIPITGAPVNQPPVFLPIEIESIPENAGIVQFSVFDFVEDPDSPVLTFTEFTDGQEGLRIEDTEFFPVEYSENVEVPIGSGPAIQIATFGGLVSINPREVADFLDEGDFGVITFGVTVTDGFTEASTQFSITIEGSGGEPDPFLVTTLDDVVDANDGFISLREAIATANEQEGVNTITFDPDAVATGPDEDFLTLVDQIEITDDLQIDGGNIVISGNDETRHFSISDGVTVELNDLALLDGFANDDVRPRDQDGGSILGGDNVTLILNSATVGTNSAGDDGGAFALGDDASIEITDSFLFANQAIRDDGGAIYVGNRGSIDIVDSQFLANSAENNGGVIYGRDDLNITADSVTIDGGVAGIDGGAIFADDNASLVGNGVVFVGNTAGDDGGAISFDDNAFIQLENSIVVANEAGDDGGAFEVDDDSSVFFFGTSAFLNSAGDDGGVIAGDDRGIIDIQTSEIFDNMSGDDGGVVSLGDDALLGTSFSSFEGNQAGGEGGVYAIADSIIASQFDGSLFIGNSATSSTSDGGVFYVGRGVANIRLEGSSAIGNFAGDDGGVFGTEARRGAELNIEVFDFGANATFSGNSAGYDGGIAAADDDATILFQNVLIENNTAGDDGGLFAVDDRANITVVGATNLFTSGNFGAGDGVLVSSDQDTFVDLNGQIFSGDDIFV